MRRSLVNPSWRLPAAALALGVASATMSCDPPAPSGACLATEMVSGADFACLRTSPTVVCNDRSDAAGAGLAGCYSASAVVRCWGQSGSNSWANPAMLDPTAFDAGAATPGIYLTLGSGPTMEAPRRIDRAGRVVPSESDWLQGVRQLAAGGGSGEPFACAVVNEGRVRCEGFGRLGQLGNGPQSGMSRSELSFGGVRARLVTAGLSHACALLEDGSVRCWGDGTYGQLGPAATSPASLPVQVTGLPKVLSFAAGSRHTCAVVEAPGAGAPDGAAQTRGEVRCWGQGESGQLGGGAFLLSATPVAVLAPSGSGNLTDVRAIAAGADHTCALVNSGAVQCWGVNGAGQLGVGSSQVRSNRPVAASLPTGVGAVYLSAGREHTCAAMGPLSLTGGFPVRCWGRMGTAFSSPPGVITDELPCCAPTPTNPTGVCPSLRSDPANCGRAGNVCAAGQACVNGACSCAPRTQCGAACVDLQTDRAHCGRCDNACPSASPGNGAVTCQSGRCAVACPTGRGDCDGNLANGCETDLNTSTMHCGVCGRAVTVANGTPACRMGVAAVMGCNMGFADCDANPTNGCEATLATDSNNCGRCGNRCAGSSGNTTSTCAMGSCGGQVCAAGFRDCNNSPSDGCETAMGAPCASPATALPTGSRIHPGGHAVNIVTSTDYDDQLRDFLDGVRGASLARATGEFYKYFRDEYDFLVVVSSDYLGETSAAGVFEAVNRDAIPGTGLGARDTRSYRTGAPRQLRGVFGVHQTRNRQGRLTATPPTLHELAHYWGVEVPGELLGISSGHWGASSVRGQLGGFPGGRATCATGGPVSACPNSQICCPSGTTNCGGACVDLQTDRAHCGTCGFRCNTGVGTTANACVNGQCVPTCATNYSDCDGNPVNGCEARIDTPARCGNADSRTRCFSCQTGFSCVNSQGINQCGARCGAAGQACCPPSSGRPLCQTGFSCDSTAATPLCCAAGQVACDGVCANTASDPSHCGACGTACLLGPGTSANACTAGRCAPTCAAGYADCDGNPANGCEALLDAATNCGACGTRCAAGQACVNTGGRRACMAAGGASAGQVCSAMGTCGGELSCSSSVMLNLPPDTASPTCRAASGNVTLPWFTAAAPGDTLPYSPLELYLMGYVDRAGAGGPWQVLDDAQQPAAGTLWGGSRVRTVTTQQIVDRLGERAPASEAERRLRTAVVVLSTRPVSDEWLDWIERWSAILGNDRMDPCLLSFQTATGGRATMSTRIGATRVP